MKYLNKDTTRPRKSARVNERFDPNGDHLFWRCQYVDSPVETVYGFLEETAVGYNPT